MALNIDYHLKPIKVRVPENVDLGSYSSLTNGKIYETHFYSSIDSPTHEIDGFSMILVSDLGRMIYTNQKKSSHIDFEDFEIVELPEERFLI